MKKGLLQYATNLREIRDLGCWRLDNEPYASFHDYCLKRHGFSQSRASQIITAADTMAQMLRDVHDDPRLTERIESLSEGVLREVKNLEPAEAIEVIKSIPEGEKITRIVVRDAVKPKPTTPIKDADLKLVPKITPSQWVDVGRKCPLFLSWWEHLSATEQEEVLAYLKSKP